MSSPEVIDVDADEPVRIAGGTGEPDAPFEIASSDSEDEKPAKRAKPAPVTPLSGARNPVRRRSCGTSFATPRPCARSRPWRA